MKKVLVLGAGGFIGSHMVRFLKNLNHYVIGVDLHYPKFETTSADEFIIGDLRSAEFCSSVFAANPDEVYQFAADMGGAGYIFTGDNDANILHNSALINLNIVTELMKQPKIKIFFSSSACIYPERNQLDPANPICSEDSAYPADPDSEYGWEKIFSERLYQTLEKNYKVPVRIGRYHNIFGPPCEWNNGKEKSPAAICRKVAEAVSGSFIEIWGDGNQTRSFLYIDECLEATYRLMNSEFSKPINIGSEEKVSIRELAQKVIDISGKDLTIQCVPGPKGVNGRTSDNTLIKSVLNWNYKQPLDQGLEKLYNWILNKINE